MGQFFLFLILFFEAITCLDTSRYQGRSLDKDKLIKFGIFATNDIHGFVFPKTKKNLETKDEWEAGGMEYISTYKNILKKKVNDYFLWLDAGDEFQGGYETKVTGGELMKEVLGEAGLSGATFGNHEFDKGFTKLKELIKDAKYPYIVANIFFNQTDNNIIADNQYPYKIFDVKGIKIGVIGMTTTETKVTTKGNITGLDFREPKEIIEEIAKKIRKDVQAIILLAHEGVLYDENQKDKCDILETLYNLKVWKKENSPTCGIRGRMYNLLNSLEKGMIDLVIAGHTHKNAHTFINDIPVVSSENNGKYANVAYFYFDKANHHLIKDKTEIEGPIPICSHVYSGNKLCDFHFEKGKDYGKLMAIKFHGQPIKKDEAITKVIQKFNDVIPKEMLEPIFSIPEPFYMNREVENVLGNFIADFIREITKTKVAIVNSGFFRTEWESGVVLRKDIFEMFPFDNNLVVIKLKGKDLIEMIRTVQSGDKSFYQTSGIIQTFKKGTHDLLEVTFSDGTPIQENEEYTVGSIDFCFGNSPGDDFAKVPILKTVKKYVIEDFRDKLIDYLLNLKEVKVENYFDPSNPRIRYKD